MYTPYTYYVYNRLTKQHYYGAKVAKHSKNIADPATFWKTYFTSCKKVKELIAKYGADSFDIEIRKVFSTSEAALLWEEKVLRRLKVMERSDWLNGNIKGEFDLTASKSLEHKRKISKALCGVPKTELHKAKIRERRKSQITTIETRKKMSEKRSHSKWITNIELTITRFVQPTELNLLLSQGWILGRHYLGARPHSESTKKQMSESKKGRVCVVNKGQLKMIDKSVLDSFLSDGWIRGRKDRR